MPQIIDVPGSGLVEFPDGMTDKDITAAIRKMTMPPAMRQGAAARPQLQDALATLQGPTFGFGDELIGGIVGGAKTLFNDKPLRQNYEETRDFVRGAVDKRMQDAPGRTMASQIIASLPVGGPLIKPIQALTRAITPASMPIVGKVAAPVLTGTLVGGTTGVINAAGDSQATDAAGVARDALNAAPAALAMGGFGVPASAAMGAVGRNVASRFSGSAAAPRQAQEKLAEALLRDEQTLQRTERRLQTLGDEARVVDAGGANTRQLLDTVATLPGTAKNQVENAIRDRQATRAGRMIGSAESAFGTGGVRMASQVDDWIQQRAAQADPLYNQVRQVSLTPDAQLVDLVRAAETLGATAQAKRIATARQQAYSLDPSNPGQFELADLDNVKRGLDQIVASASGTNATGKLTPFGAAVDDLRRNLITKLDGMTGGPTGIYAQARNAFAGPSQLMDAAARGRTALTQDDASIRAMQQGMTSSERDAFALGAFESLRAKLGARAGQTQIMELWREQGLQEKLKAIFGNERAYREFAADVARERRMKAIENVGRGSQTAARLQAADDLDISPLAQAAQQAARGDVMGTVASLRSTPFRVMTPEPVRNALGEILLSRGPQGVNRLRDLQDAMREVEAARAASNALYGIGLGSISSNVLPVN